MTGNNRFMIDVEPEFYENAVFDLGNFVCFADDSDRLVEKLNELSAELAIYESKYIGLKELTFTRMGGFSMFRDRRGRYSILSENVIPKNSPVIQIKSPDTILNKFIADILCEAITDVGYE